MKNSIVWFGLSSLLVFLFYWNYQEYLDAKQELHDALEIQMELSISEVRDSTIQFILEELPIEGESIDNFEQVGDEPIYKRKDGAKDVIFFEIDSSIENDSLELPKMEKLNANLKSFVNDNYKLPQDTLLSLSSSLKNIYTAFEKDNKEIIAKRFLDRLKSYNLPTSFRIIENVDSLNAKNNSISIPLTFSFNLKSDYKTTPKSLAVFDNLSSFYFFKLIPNISVSILLFFALLFGFLSLLKSKKQQEQLLQIKNDFIGNMTHELKTPISTVNVALEAINNFGALNDPIKIKEYLSISQLELGRLNNLIDKVLKLSKYEKGEFDLTKKEIDIQQLMSDVLQSLKLQFDKYDINLVIDQNGSDFHINGDDSHIKSMFYNLLDNAIKYRKENAMINVNLEEDGNRIKIEVEDNGIGIPQQYQQNIFDRFFRIPNNDHHNVKGYGLGLNYVKQIVQSHGGEITCFSNEGDGTKFIIVFPKNSNHD